MRSTEYNPVAGRPHHGLVAYDPEAYYLEWDVFKDVPGNRHIVSAVESGVRAGL